MLGFSLSVLHISYDDFCRLTPEEYLIARKTFYEEANNRRQEDWERMRMLAAITIQPYCKKKLTPQKLLPFPWDNKRKFGSKTPVKGNRQRMKEMFEKYGNTY